MYESKHNFLQILLNTIEKTIDSIKSTNSERRISIQIFLDKHTSYQTFIDILDLFEKKQSKLYGVAKNTVFWVE